MRRGRIGPASYKDQIGVQSHSQSLTAASVELKGVTGAVTGQTTHVDKELGVCSSLDSIDVDMRKRKVDMQDLSTEPTRWLSKHEKADIVHCRSTTHPQSQPCATHLVSTALWTLHLIGRARKTGWKSKRNWDHSALFLRRTGSRYGSLPHGHGPISDHAGTSMMETWFRTGRSHGMCQSLTHVAGPRTSRAARQNGCRCTVAFDNVCPTIM